MIQSIDLTKRLWGLCVFHVASAAGDLSPLHELIVLVVPESPVTSRRQTNIQPTVHDHGSVPCSMDRK